MAWGIVGPLGFSGMCAGKPSFGEKNPNLCHLSIARVMEHGGGKRSAKYALACWRQPLQKLPTVSLHLKCLLLVGYL